MVGEKALDWVTDRSVVTVVIAALALGGTVDYAAGQLADATYGADAAKEYVKESGYKNPELESVNHWLVDLQGCGDGDMVEYEFKATAQNGNRVDIDVCKGILKGATLRQG